MKRFFQQAARCTRYHSCREISNLVIRNFRIKKHQHLSRITENLQTYCHNVTVQQFSSKGHVTLIRNRCKNNLSLSL